MAASGGSLAPDIMVFRPTMEEFKDFSGYIANMESQGAHKAGIAKIVPPKSWCPCKGGYDNIDLVIPAPISQVVTGSQGLFQQVSVQRKSMSVSEFKKLAESSKYKTPHHTDYEDLERKYWDCMTSHSPIYGADVSGSIYDDGVEEFNIQHLNTILDLVANDYGVKIEGVNTAYLYFGMWKTTFAWHTEDMDLYSINYLHFGAPKSWYAIPPEHGHLLEQVAASYFYDSLQNCPAYLRHKMIIMSPDILKKYSVPFSKITQEPGEFIITFPYGYHSGYNHGFNCAESTNFAMPRWVEYGKRAVVCNCQNDSVKISMDVFIRKFQPERYGLWKTGKDVGPHPEDPSRHYAASLINDQVVSVLDLISDRLHQPRLSFPKWKCEANEYGLKLTVDASRKRPSRLCHQTTRSPGESTLCGGESSSFPYASFFTSIAKNKKTKKVKANSENLENPPNLTLGDAAEKKEGNANQEYSPKSELRKFIKNVKEAAVSWAYPISDIQKHQELNLEAEKQFNIWMSSFEPHCSVCIIFTTVSNQNRVSFEDFPSSSLVKMPEICFSKNIDVHCKQDKNPLLRRDGSSPLLVCFVCHVCVHASCYGVKFLEYGLWTCSRCANQAEDAECCLCSLRGGALKPTTDGRWAHIVCASFIQEAYFEDVVLRGPVNILRLTSNMSSKCIYCSKLLKSNTGCCIQCSSSRCSSSFHVTCGHLAGSSFEHRDWPDLFSISCVKHSSHKTKSRKRELTDVSVGDAVLAEHKNHKYQWAEVKNKYCQTYYSVVFPDYSTCTDLLPEDIVNENGIEHELPEIDDRVLVKWTDGEIYKCLFKGSRSFDVYVVEFSDCTSTKLERHQFYSTDEELPNEVSSKVAWSRGKSKTSCAVQQNNKRICLRNVN